MKKDKHKPPSRVRYEKKNPVFSVRIPKKWFNDINKIIKETEQSRKDFIGVALKKQKAKYKKLEKKMYDKGFKDGFDKYVIWYYCDVCNKWIVIKQESDSHKAVIKYMKEHKWGHARCHDKN